MTHRVTLAAARSIGPDAWRSLEGGARGCVAAVFERSFYTRFGSDWICFGGRNIPPGPLNVVCDLVGSDPWEPVKRAGLQVECCEGTLLFASGHRIDVSGAVAWQPPPPPDWTAESLLQGCAALRALLPPDLPSEGLSGYLQEDDARSSATARAAAASIAALTDWLATGEGAQSCIPAPAAEGLLGLGPGLTPSGDDFLAGVLIGLRHLGQESRADALAQAVLARAEAATVAVSAAHLRCAAQGRAAEPLHRAFNTVALGEREGIRSALGDFAALGHNSPWDSLAGYVTVLKTSRPTHAEGVAGPVR